MPDSLWPHGLQYARLPCPSPTPTAYSNSCPSHQWCHPTISSFVIPFSSCLQSFPASGSFPILRIRWLKFRSLRFSISPYNEFSGLISFRIDRLDVLAVQWTLKSLLQHHSSKTSILWHSAFFIVQLSHPYVVSINIASIILIEYISLFLWSLAPYPGNEGLNGIIIVWLCLGRLLFKEKKIYV